MFPFTRTVLIFFIAGLLFIVPRARRSLGAYRIPWRPAFSHLVSALLGHLGDGASFWLGLAHSRFVRRSRIRGFLSPKRVTILYGSLSLGRTTSCGHPSEPGPQQG